jgi:hypothetical protein
MVSNDVKTPAEINREPRGQQSQYAGFLTDAETLVDTNAAAKRRELNVEAGAGIWTAPI